VTYGHQSYIHEPVFLVIIYDYKHEPVF